jgi:hypothetical protein
MRTAKNASESSLSVSFHAQEQTSLILFDGVQAHTFRAIAASPRVQIEEMRVQRTDHSSAAEHAFSKRSTAVRAPVLRGKQAAIALSENGDLLSTDDEAAPLSHRDRIDATQIDTR